MSDPHEQPSNLLPTLKELRQRLVTVLVALGLTTALAYAYSQETARFFIAPLFRVHPDLGTLVYTNLTEAFLTYIKTSFILGLIATFPVACFQLWMFVSPGLYRHEKKAGLAVVFWATLLFGSGVVFAYWSVLPRMLSFFLSFSSPALEPKLKLGDYLTFVARLSLGFGLAFEIPFLMMAAAKTGIVVQSHFRKRRLAFYGVIAVFAFLLVAGDLLATLLLAIPLLGLYEAGIFLTGFFTAKKDN